MLFRKNFQLSLLDILHDINKSAFASEIQSCVSTIKGEKKPSLGAVVMTLNRLEEKGLVSFILENNDSNFNGTNRRIFTITAKGKCALKDHLNSFRSLAKLYPAPDPALVTTN